MFPRERGSRTLAHESSDPRCCEAEAAALDDEAVCQVCAAKLTREQAASAFNLRTLGS